MSVGFLGRERIEALILVIASLAAIVAVSGLALHQGRPLPPPAPPVPAPPQASAAGRTTIEMPGGIRAPAGDTATQAPAGRWAYGCVAIVTAPRSMTVGHVETVDSTLLVAAGKDGIQALMQAAGEAARAINAGTDPADASRGLSPATADAIRRLAERNHARQAAVDSLAAAPIVTAHLVGPGFEITPATPERQAGVTPDRPASWQWVVKATEAGERTLTVTYTTEVMVGTERVPQTLRSITRDVTVHVSGASLLQGTDDSVKAVRSIAENGVWLWTMVVFPVLIFLYGCRKWIRGAPR